ncbi:MAG: hypothetical protein Q9191_004750 [Dirinaria sp. TL-2023a]
MPPRLPRAAAAHTSYQTQLPQPLLRCAQCLHKSRQQQQPFSSTSPHSTRLRRTMFKWLNGPGANFKNPLPGSTNYLNAYDSQGQLIRAMEDGSIGGRKYNQNDTTPPNATDDEADMPSKSEMVNLKGNKPLPPETLDDLLPFPLNRQFRSAPVLSEEFKDEIYQRVVTQGHPVRRVSSEMNVEMRRVGAVVRLKALEKQWEEQGKTLALPYANAILAMLPVTHYDRAQGRPRRIHESINDLPVHTSTLRQLFLPAPESRHFTRQDAARALDPGLLPADARVPHPELIAAARDRATGMGNTERRQKMAEREEREKEVLKKRKEKSRAREEKAVTKVVPVGGRWEFRFRDVKADVVEGERDRRGIGSRYGVPPQDRKKGVVKIPKRVVPV